MWNAQADAPGGYVGIETYGGSVRPILTFTHRYHLLAIGSESRQPVTLDYMARYMLSDLSFDDYLRAGGWRGYTQRPAKDAFVTEARSWLEHPPTNARRRRGTVAGARMYDSR